MMCSSRHHLLVALLAVLCSSCSVPAVFAEVDSDFGFSPARALLQSGTSCPNQIPGCMPRRCTTRTVDNIKDRYVCLRCKQGMVPVLSTNRKSILQCICPAGSSFNTVTKVCDRCPVGSYCPGGNRRADDPTDNLGQVINCNNPGSTGLTTRNQGATRPSDCVATAGYVLPTTRGGNATLCTGATYAPNNNKLSSCLKCQSGLEPPPNFSGPRTDKTQVCQLPPGRFWELNVVRDCPKGLYRENYVLVTEKVGISCVPCPLGWTTPGISTTAIGFCNSLLPGYKIDDVTPGDNSNTTLAPQGPTDVPEEATLCPIGFYYDGNSTGIFGCVQCPTGSTTRNNGSTSLDECVVPPGYFLNNVTNTMTKCPSNTSTGTGYYRAGWVSFRLVQDSDGTRACTPCGAGILSEPTSADELPDLTPNPADPFDGLVASSSASCYIQAGWGITIDPNDFKSYRSIAPCPANTYGVANKTFGLINAPCKACSKNLYSPAGSTNYTDCKNPAGFGYNSEGANQCQEGFYSPAEMMMPCIQCPPCRTTPPYVPGDGSLQANVSNCLIIPGCGVTNPNDTNPFNPPNPGPNDPGAPCPIGTYTDASMEPGNYTVNPKCQNCSAGTSTSTVGATVCDVCAAGFGAITSTGNVTADCANTCPFGYFGDSTSTTCGKCPNTVFNHEYGLAVTSYGVTFYPGLPDDSSCVPRFSQLPNPAGHIMTLPAAMLTASLPSGAVQGAVPLEGCVKTCPADKCCITQYQATNATEENVGTCFRAVLDPIAPDTTTAKLYYKLPPSELIAAASVDDVKAQTKSSGIYARCSLSAFATEAGNGEIGTSPFPTDIEQPSTFTRWNEPRCNSEATCEATCDALATCWGYIFVPGAGKGYAIRGGEMQVGYRTFFVSPDALLAPAALDMPAKLW